MLADAVEEELEAVAEPFGGIGGEGPGGELVLDLVHRQLRRRPRSGQSVLDYSVEASADPGGELLHGLADSGGPDGLEHVEVVVGAGQLSVVDRVA